MKVKDLVTVISGGQEAALGKVLMVKEVLGKDSATGWFLLTDGQRDFIMSGSALALSVEYNVEEEG